MLFYERRFILNDEEIVGVRNDCDMHYRKQAGKRKKLDSELLLMVEEVLTLFRGTFGEGHECIAKGKKAFGNIHFEISAKGYQVNPLVESVDAEYSRAILEKLGIVPVYRYNARTGENIVSFLAPLKPTQNKMLHGILIALALAAASYFILLLCSQDARDLIQNSIIAPLFTKITAIIATVATPLVFFSVIDGITGMGSSLAVGRIGKKLLRNMLLIYLIAGVVFTVSALLVYPVQSISGVSGEDVVGQVVTLVLDIVPSNVLKCFVEDNDLQVITLAIFIGVVLLCLGEKVAKVNEAVRLISTVVNKMMTVICKLLPLVVFLGVLDILLQDASDLIKTYKTVILLAISVVVIICVMFIRVKKETKASIAKLFKHQLPTTLINLATSSQVAALPENSKCCKEKFGIDGKFVDFSLPLYIVTYMPCGAAFLGLTTWCMADISGVPIDVISVIKIAFLAIVIAIAAPPIPGSAFAVLPIMFSSCGINLTYYSVAIALGTVLGHFLPLLNGFCMQLELLITGKQLNLVDKEKLEALMPNKKKKLKTE